MFSVPESNLHYWFPTSIWRPNSPLQSPLLGFVLLYEVFANGESSDTTTTSVPGPVRSQHGCRLGRVICVLKTVPTKTTVLNHFLGPGLRSRYNSTNCLGYLVGIICYIWTKLLYMTDPECHNVSLINTWVTFQWEPTITLKCVHINLAFHNTWLATLLLLCNFYDVLANITLETIIEDSEWHV
jgi:hypothetical protein